MALLTGRDQRQSSVMLLFQPPSKLGVGRAHQRRIPPLQFARRRACAIRRRSPSRTKSATHAIQEKTVLARRPAFHPVRACRFFLRRLKSRPSFGPSTPRRSPSAAAAELVHPADNSPARSHLYARGVGVTARESPYPLGVFDHHARRPDRHVRHRPPPPLSRRARRAAGSLKSAMTDSRSSIEAARAKAAPLGVLKERPVAPATDIPLSPHGPPPYPTHRSRDYDDIRLFARCQP